jgi:hypothetical protein
MQRAIALLSIAAVLLFSGIAFSATEQEPAQYAGHIYVDVQTGESVFVGPNEAPAAGVDIYSNVLSPALGAISSTSLTSIWGDHVLMTGLGILSQHDLTIYNSSSSLGPLLTANVAINFYNFTTSVLIGGYTGTINFGAGLGVGFYSIVSFINLETLAIPIAFATNDIVVTQNLTAKTGTGNRFGVVLLEPVTIGTSPSTMYINSPTIGPAGYYTVGTGNANPGYRINAIAPVATEPTTWGKVKSLYR